jgi:hypothetical protein
VCNALLVPGVPCAWCPLCLVSMCSPIPILMGDRIATRGVDRDLSLACGYRLAPRDQKPTHRPIGCERRTFANPRPDIRFSCDPSSALGRQANAEPTTGGAVWNPGLSGRGPGFEVL